MGGAGLTQGPPSAPPARAPSPAAESPAGQRWCGLERGARPGGTVGAGAHPPGELETGGMDGRMDGGGWMEGGDRRVDREVEDGLMDIRREGQMDGQMHGEDLEMGWTNRGMSGRWEDRQMDEWKEGQIMGSWRVVGRMGWVELWLEGDRWTGDRQTDDGQMDG